MGIWDQHIWICLVRCCSCGPLGSLDDIAPQKPSTTQKEVFWEETGTASSYSCEWALGEKGSKSACTCQQQSCNVNNGHQIWGDDRIKTRELHILIQKSNLADHVAQARVVLRFPELIIRLMQDDTPNKPYEELNLTSKILNSGRFDRTYQWSASSSTNTTKPSHRREEYPSPFAAARSSAQ